MTHHTAEHRNDAMSQCIDHCTECHAICLETLAHGLSMGGDHAAPDHIALLSACADICRTGADTMLRGTDVHVFTCQACAEICRRCAEDCERFGDDPAMQRCARMCRACADSCAAMAKHEH